MEKRKFETPNYINLVNKYDCEENLDAVIWADYNNNLDALISDDDYYYNFIYENDDEF